MSSRNHLTWEQKLAFIEQLHHAAVTLAELCRAFRISRQTGHKWWRRYQRHGPAGLQERSRRPRRSPQAIAAVWLERLRLARRRHRRWGPKKLRPWLQQQHRRSRVPSVSTLGRLLRRHRWSQPVLGRRHGPDRAWPAIRQARHPNDVWTVDFKGYFHTRDGRRCDPLTVRDAYSRFGLCIQVLHGHKLPTVQRVFLRLFRKFG